MTDIYALTGYTKAAGQTRINGVLVEAQANVGDFDAASSNNKQFIASIGLRHSFSFGAFDVVEDLNRANLMVT